MKSPAVKMQNSQQRALQCIAMRPLLILFAFFAKFFSEKVRRLVLKGVS